MKAGITRLETDVDTANGSKELVELFFFSEFN